MKKKWIWSVVVVLVVAGGCGLADRMLKGRSHPGLATFLRQWWTNYPASFAVEPPVLSMRVESRDLDALQEVVEAARERGVIMPEGNDYVPAELEFEGGTFKAKVRIKGKMSDHVKGSKWSFRVVAKKDKGFLGMQRFSLQHPGTRNYLCDWFYHRLMKGEGVIALRYGFIGLRFNDEDLGVYAYEEHFGPELLANNGRLKGPVFRFDPGLFWVHRLNMMRKIRYDEPFGVYEAAAVDAFGSGDVAKDSVQRKYLEEAVGRMDGFRRGELTASEVFDADRLARRHAILDLVGGHHSMDWSDVKFYYDPVLKRVEPIAYESFSAFSIRTLAGSDRYVGGQRAGMDLHDAYFNDPVVFRSYVHHLERVSARAYLDSAFQTLAPALDSASAVVYREFPYKELDRSIYYGNQAIIRRLLDVPKGFHAYAEGGSDTLRFMLVSIEGLPIEVHGLVMPDGTLLPPDAPVIVPCRAPGKVGAAMSLRIPMPPGVVWPAGASYVVRYSVLGASVRKQLEALPYGYMDGVSVPVLPTASRGVEDTKLFWIDEAARTINFIPGTHRIANDIVVPPGYVLKGVAPLRLDLVQGARIVSRSPVSLLGNEDAPVVIGSSDASGGGVVLLETGGRSTFRHFRSDGFGKTPSNVAGIVVQQATVKLEHCRFGEVPDRDLLLVVRGHMDITDCEFTGGRDQVTLAYSGSRMDRVSFNGAGDDAVVQKGGLLRATATAVHGASGNALKVDEHGVLKISAGTIEAHREALVVSEGADVSVEGGAMGSRTGRVIDVKAKHARHGASHVTLEGVTLPKAADALRIGPGNDVLIDGQATTGASAGSE